MASDRQKMFAENVRQALGIIRAHRMRSGLLILGVAIGIMTILAMVTVMSGLVRKINDDLEASSKPYLFIMRFDFFESQGGNEELFRRQKFTAQDADMLQKNVPAADKVSYFVTTNTTSFVIYYQGRHTPQLELDGASHTFPEMFSLPLEHGRHFTQSEVERRERVVTIGYGPAQDLFGPANPIGKYVTINSQKYRVIGTFANREHFIGSISNNFAVIPYTSYHKDFQTELDDPSIAINAREGYTLDELDEQVTAALRIARGVGPGEENDFYIMSSTAFIAIVGRVTVAISAVLSVIASIGLLVGGIGVMNIMLISVTERTREIGIRMALGANKKDITQQFLMESATLTGIGGVVGTLVGVIVAWAVSSQINFPFYFSIPWTIAAVLFSALIGIIFGLYPARRAARLDPVEALRVE